MQLIFVLTVFTSIVIGDVIAIKCNTCTSIGTTTFANCVSKASQDLDFKSQRVYKRFNFAEDAELCVTEFRTVPAGDLIVTRAGIKRDPKNLIPWNACINIDVEKIPNVSANNVTLCTCSTDNCNTIESPDFNDSISSSAGTNFIGLLSIVTFMAASFIF